MSSRFEDMVNALLKGEHVDFDPHSRLEEYLQACINGTTADLPTPISRSEILLYQLAVKIASGGGGSNIPTYSGSHTVNPSTVDQILQTSGKMLTSNVTVKGVTNVRPEIIAKGEKILDVTGTAEFGGGFPNGTEWTPISIPGGSSLMNITYGNGMWVASDIKPESNYELANGLFYSYDGRDWYSCSVDSKLDYATKIIYADGMWMALGISRWLSDSNEDGVYDYCEEYDYVYRSTDGINWTVVNQGNCLYAYTGEPQLFYKDGLWIYAAPNADSSIYMTSVDGVTWISSGELYGPPEELQGLNGVAKVWNVNGVLFAQLPWYYLGPYYGDHLFASHDGVTWYMISYSSSIAYYSVLYYKGVYLWSYMSDGQKTFVVYTPPSELVLGPGTYMIGTSIELPNASNLIPMETCVLCGPNISSDGKTWTTWSCTNGITVTNVYDGINFKGKLVVATDKGIVYSTDNGTTWTQSSICTVDCTKLLESNGVLIAAASNGIFYSRDGATWIATNVTDPTTNIEYANGILVTDKHYSVVWEPSN